MPIHFHAMPKKNQVDYAHADDTESPETETTVAHDMQTYFCPTIGHGVSVQASSPQEALEKLSRLK